MNHSLDETDRIRNRLLVAAFQEEARPGRVNRKCAAVIRRTLINAGNWDNQAATDMYEGDGLGEVGILYRTLISMIGDEESDGTMFVGQGNFLLPAAPLYTECRLTAAGETVAKRLTEAVP